MQDVVPGLAQELTCGLVQLTSLPLVELVPDVIDAGVVPRREMINPWQYPPGDGFVGLPTAGIGPWFDCPQAPCVVK